MIGTRTGRVTPESCASFTHSVRLLCRLAIRYPQAANTTPGACLLTPPNLALIGIPCMYTLLLYQNRGALNPEVTVDERESV